MNPQTEPSLFKSPDCTKISRRTVPSRHKSPKLNVKHYNCCSDNEAALYLDGRVQRVLVEFLVVGSDVQQIDLWPTHHDSVQSRLVRPTTLTMIRAAKTYFRIDSHHQWFWHLQWKLTNLHALIQALCKVGRHALHTFHCKRQTEVIFARHDVWWKVNTLFIYSVHYAIP